MSDLRITIVRGRAAQQDIAAISVALLKLQTESIAKAERASALPQWIVASRLAATRNNVWWNRSWQTSLR